MRIRINVLSLFAYVIRLLWTVWAWFKRQWKPLRAYSDERIYYQEGRRYRHRLGLRVSVAKLTIQIPTFALVVDRMTNESLTDRTREFEGPGHDFHQDEGLMWGHVSGPAGVRYMRSDGTEGTAEANMTVLGTI